MLVLARLVGEKVVIGDGDDRIEIMVVEIDRNKVRLGIEARRGIPIFRSELLPLNPSITPPAVAPDGP
jgi:carbon storage regulator